MELAKGSYVHCKKTDKVGVVDKTPHEKDFVYVRWFTYWDLNRHEPNNYLAFVAVADLEDLAPEKIHTGLQTLRQQVLR